MRGEDVRHWGAHGDVGLAWREPSRGNDDATRMGDMTTARKKTRERAKARAPARRRGTGAPDPLVPTFDEGVKAMLEERWTDAVKVFSARVIASPSDLNSRTNLAVALGESHRWEDAAREFERVVADPSSKPLPEFHSLGHCYYNLGRHLEAVEAFRQYFLRATRRNPVFAPALVCLGLALQELRHPLAARALLMQGVRMSPDAENFEYLARFFWSETMGPDALGAIVEAAERKLESPGLASLLDEVLKEMETRAPQGRPVAAPVEWDAQPSWTGKGIAECCADILAVERKAKNAREADDIVIDDGDAPAVCHGSVETPEEREASEDRYNAWLRKMEPITDLVYPEAVDDEEGDEEGDDE